MMNATLAPSSAINGYQKINGGYVFTSAREKFRVIPVADGIIRISACAPDLDLPERTGLGIEYNGVYEDAQFLVKEDRYIVISGKAAVDIDRKTSALTYRLGVRPVLYDREKVSRELSYFDSFKSVIDENSVISEIQTPDGVKKVIEKATTVFDRRLCHTKLNLEFDENEDIFGLGQSENGEFNYRYQTRYLNQANMAIAVPFFISTNGYGILSATSGAAIFSDLEDGTYLYTDADEFMDYYFITGPSFDSVISGYRKLTGKVKMLPKWAFGFVQSQERYESTDEWRSLCDKFEENDIGVDCIVQDWCTWGRYGWGQKTFDPDAYPDVEDAVKYLENKGVHLMLSIWANPAKETKDYAEFLENGCMLPGGDFYDAFSEKARKIYWKQLKECAFDKGIKAFWSDSSEPYSPEWGMTFKPTPGELYQTYIKQASASIPRDLINAYCLVHSKGLYEGQRGETDDYRVVNLTRSAHTGSQRYGTICWSGDISATWKVLFKQVAAGMNFCASGFPFWTLDIGGFFVKNGVQWFWNGDYDNTNSDKGYLELFTRWFQFGAFLPIFRSHGTDLRREIWEVAKYDKKIYDILKETVDLRYRLLPYIYSEAAYVCFDDSTMMRMLPFDFPNDEEARYCVQEYMFGHAFLVCPVTGPVKYGPDSEDIYDGDTTMRIYLPAGCKWYDFYTRESYDGGQYIQYRLSIEHMPVFVKGGSIVPMTDTVKHTRDSSAQKIHFHVYPGANCSFKLYDDAGDGYGYEKGEYTRREIKWDDKKRSLYGDVQGLDYDVIIH